MSTHYSIKSKISSKCHQIKSSKPHHLNTVQVRLWVQSIWEHSVTQSVDQWNQRKVICSPNSCWGRHRITVTWYTYSGSIKKKMEVTGPSNVEIQEANSLRFQGLEIIPWESQLHWLESWLHLLGSWFSPQRYGIG